MMKQILANHSASISELKKNPTALLNESAVEPVAIHNHNKPIAYLVCAETYELMIEKLDDQALAKTVKQRMALKSEALAVNLDDL